MKQFYLIKSQKWNRERERIDRMKLPNKKNNPVFSLMSHHQLDLQDPNEAVNHSADKSNYQVILYLYLNCIYIHIVLIVFVVFEPQCRQI